MARQSQSIQWVLLGPHTPVDVGDLVSAEAGGLPVYHVLALGEGRAVLRDERDGRWELPLSRFHWKAC